MPVTALTLTAEIKPTFGWEDSCKPWLTYIANVMIQVYGIYIWTIFKAVTKILQLVHCCIWITRHLISTCTSHTLKRHSQTTLGTKWKQFLSDKIQLLTLVCMQLQAPFTVRTAACTRGLNINSLAANSNFCRNNSCRNHRDKICYQMEGSIVHAELFSVPVTACTRRLSLLAPWVHFPTFGSVT